MAAPPEVERAAELLERLLTDAPFRARFRASPAAACREYELPELAEELDGSMKAIFTLEARESKSSLAGVVMAAAAEGVGVFELAHHMGPGMPHETAAAVHQALTHAGLRAVQADQVGGGGGGGAHFAEATNAGAGSGAAAHASGAAAAAPPAPGSSAASNWGAPAQHLSSGPAGADPTSAAPHAGAGAAAPHAQAAAAAPHAEAATAAPHASSTVVTPRAEPATHHVAEHHAVHHPAADSVATDQPVGGGGGTSGSPGTAAPPDPVTGAAPPPGVAPAGPVEAVATAPTAGTPAAPVDPSTLVPSAAGSGGGGGSVGASALSVAHTQLGVHEIGGANVGPQVDRYLAAAGVPPGNPWCASFVTWSLEHAGHKMPGGGWAAVSTWVQHAESHQDGLHVVSADQAQPGDLVCYDWGGGTDFGSDGHIGFLASNVHNGQFTALEGNNADSVAQVSRHLGGGPNIVFIHVDGAGSAPAGAGAVDPTAAAAGTAPAVDPTAAAVPGAAPAAVDPAAVPGAAPAPGVAGVAPVAPVPSAGTAVFRAVQPTGTPGAGSTAHFLQSVQPGQGQPAAGTPVAAPVDQAAGAPSGAADVAASAVDSAGAGHMPYPGDNASKDQLAAWMADQAQARGLPRQLPVMASLVESSLHNDNFGDRDSVGYFQMRTGTWDEGPYKGFQNDPNLQVKWFLDQAEGVKKQWISQGRGADLQDPNKFGEWIADVERPAEQYRGRYQLQLDNANHLLTQHAATAGPSITDAATSSAAPGAPAPVAAPVAPEHVAASLDPASAAAAVDPATLTGGAGGGSPLGASALQIAHTQLGVHEIGSTNTGPQVDKYLAAGGVPPGNPWCASFVTWSLEHAGHKMPGSGWAAVATWVQHAEAHQNGLHVVSPDQARPGDLVCYDWGGGTDFGNDGHIGFLASNVHNGQFSALEGNNGDAVNEVPRHLGGGPNIVFIRVDGNAPAGAGAGVAPAAGAASVDPTAVAGAPAAAAPGVAPGVAGVAPVAPVPSAGTAVFRAVQPTGTPGAGSTAHFLQSVQPGQGQPAAGTPVAAPVDQAAGAPSGAADVAASAVDSAGAGHMPYPGDNASKDQLAAWMADQAQARGLPRQLPVMASLVESSLHNDNFGDRDSVGYFQMRTGTWDEGPYKGFQNDPNLQVKWFLDQAEGVKKQWISQGRGADLQDPNKFGEWIADVERPAEQYRGRYQLQLDNANHLLTQHAATATPGTAAGVTDAASSAPAGSGAADAAASSAGNGSGAAAILDATAAAGGGQGGAQAVSVADRYLGTPYLWGGTSPKGFDCSGFTQYVYHQVGIDIPRVAEDQFTAAIGQKVDRANLQPGDLVFFGDPSGYIHHTGMYVGHGEFIHAPHTGDHVRISSLDDPYYKQQFAGGRRLEVGAGGSTSAAAAPDPTAAAAPAPAPAAAVAPVDAAPAPAAAAPVDPAAAAPVADVTPAQKGTAVFAALAKQESSWHRNTVQFLKAVTPQDAAAHATPAAAAAPVVDPSQSAAAPVDPTQAAAGSSAPAVDPTQASPSGAADAVASAVDPSMIPSGYPGDNATKAALAEWMADAAAKRGLPRELPVMASLVESGLHNDNYGDRDSVGYFQMRTGIWDEGPYKNFQHRPELQLMWFLDQAEQVKKQRLAAGQASSLTDPRQYGNWVADVERCATQYRGRYQLRLSEARNLLQGEEL